MSLTGHKPTCVNSFISFLHYHEHNEETIRTIKCTSSESLRYICIQAKSNSLEQCTMSDGVIVE